MSWTRHLPSTYEQWGYFLPLCLSTRTPRRLVSGMLVSSAFCCNYHTTDSILSLFCCPVLKHILLFLFVSNISKYVYCTVTWFSLQKYLVIFYLKCRILECKTLNMNKISPVKHWTMMLMIFDATIFEATNKVYGHSSKRFYQASCILKGLNIYTWFRQIANVWNRWLLYLYA